MGALSEGPSPGEPVLELKGITKRFPGVVANEGIDFEMRAGEIHAVLGENGAGKTTLMKILFGVLQPDAGEMWIHGRQVRFRSPLDAIALGIGMVHQDRKLVEAHTVLENILLGHPRARGVLQLRQAEDEIRVLCEKYGFRVELRAKIWQLSEGEKQIAEILKALYRGARILILDEPTSALTPLETEKFLESVKAMAGGELALVPFITHKLPAVRAISHRVTVLRRGKVVARVETSQTSEAALTQHMVGREVLLQTKRVATEPGKPIFEVANLTALNDKRVEGVQGVSFTLREGEILGVAAVAGNGQHELAEVIAGLRGAVSGRMTFAGKDFSKASVLDRWRMGMAYVPPERRDVASVGDLSLVENVALNFYFEPEFHSRGLLDYGKLRELTEQLIAEYNVATPGPDVTARSLSGGNLQRLILARILKRRPRVLIACLPTQGLDVAAQEFVCNKLMDAKQDNTAILLISEDLDEILSLSDRIAPMYEGKLMDILPAQDADRNTVGALMAGVQTAGAVADAAR